MLPGEHVPVGHEAVVEGLVFRPEDAHAGPDCVGPLGRHLGTVVTKVRQHHCPRLVAGLRRAREGLASKPDISNGRKATESAAIVISPIITPRNKKHQIKEELAVFAPCNRRKLGYVRLLKVTDGQMDKQYMGSMW